MINQFFLSDQTLYAESTRLRLNEIISREQVPAKSVVLEKEKHYSDLIFIEKGSVRSVFKKYFAEITSWIYLEGDLVSPLYCLKLGKPCMEEFVAVEDSDLIRVDYAAFAALRKADQVLSAHYTIYLEERSAQFEHQVLQYQALNSMEKWKHFSKTNPDLIQRLPLKHLAAWLGMDPATLSRARKRSLRDHS